MSTRLTLLLFLTSIFLSISKWSNSQVSVDDLLAKTWQFKMPTRITEVNKLGESISNPSIEIAENNFQFRVTNIRSDGALVIKFLKWGVETVRDSNGIKLSEKSAGSRNANLNERLYMKNFERNLNNKTRDENYRYFLLARSDFDAKCEERQPKNQFSLGAMTLPIKVRFGEKDKNGENKSYSSFTGNISLGLSFGLKHNYTRRFAVNYLAGFSLSAIPVSSETTKGFIENETNQAAVTWHAGVLTEIDNFQIGIFTGIDYLSGKIQKEWVYRNKPWLGVGIGFSFFNTKSTTDKQ
ncbi:hypothetical protein HRG84_13495 [Flavisolibacter sp. BT320]|nr:hypothetical protein [Flavisolibacter longurius]